MERYESRYLSSAQLRKIKKPIIERRRRERINDSLNQLKTLLLDALNKDEAQNSKMEKADILELAVSYLGSLKVKQQQQGGSANVNRNVGLYQSGYSECVKEVGRYLHHRSNNIVDSSMASRVVSHVSSSPGTSPMTSPIPECTRRSSLPGGIYGQPLYVDVHSGGNSNVPLNYSKHSTVPLLKVSRRDCSVSPLSPEEAEDAPAMPNNQQVQMDSPRDNSNHDAQPGSPVWRPW